MWQAIKDFWARVKAWFKNSETILLARLEMLTGFLVTAFSVMDWSPLLASGIHTGLSWTQATALGMIVFVKGIISEWARRLNTVVIGERLVPTAAVVEEIAETEKKEEKKISKKKAKTLEKLAEVTK